MLSVEVPVSSSKSVRTHLKSTFLTMLTCNGRFLAVISSRVMSVSGVTITSSLLASEFSLASSESMLVSEFSLVSSESMLVSEFRLCQVHLIQLYQNQCCSKVLLHQYLCLVSQHHYVNHQIHCHQCLCQVHQIQS